MGIINSFPGYEYVDGKNMYRGDDLGKGGYVYALKKPNTCSVED